MQTLPNGLVVFNVTPHPITFWDESWSEPINVPVYNVVRAFRKDTEIRNENGVSFMKTEFMTTTDGMQFLSDIRCEVERNQITNYVIVGSIIAAQAYIGEVMAMVPCAGYESVPNDEKRVRCNMFTTFE